MPPPLADALRRRSGADTALAVPCDAGRVACALFLDVDGTLLDLAPTPDAVIVPQALRDTLGILQARLDGALAVISGRNLETLDRLFRPLELPAGAQHGLEWRDASGAVRNFAEGEIPDDIRAAFAAFAARHPGALVEDKGLGLALHVRNAPEAEPAAWALGARLAARHGDAVRMIAGKRVVEFQLKGGDKGRVIERFMATPPFARRMPLFVGDDETDEAGFAAVNRLGGITIRVGAGAATAAQFEIDSPEAFRLWLGTAAELLSAGDCGRCVP